ncbi:MAG: RGCVC family protein [Actinomycetota bacterium]|nr:RGCVC family protein [Actinomycetota bacterium]
MTPTKVLPICDVCSHPIELHDHIAERYCNATRTNAATRGCVCAVAKVPVGA